MAAKIPKQKAVKLFEQARIFLSQEQFAEAERLLADISAQSDLKSPLIAAGLGDAAMGQGRVEEAIAIYREGLARFPNDPELYPRLCMAYARQEKWEQALELFERADAKLKRSPPFLANQGYVQVGAGKLEEAEKTLGRAVALGAGPEARLTLALVWAKVGRYRDAESVCARIAAGAHDNAVLRDSAEALQADCLLFLGQAEPALAIWKRQRMQGRIQKPQLGHMAYAAQLAGEAVLCDELIAECVQRGPTPEDLLLFAQIANVRSNPGLALERLDASLTAPGERHAGHAFEVDATRGRALRLLGRREEARRVLEAALARPEAESRRLGPKLHVDLGHLSAEDGDFEAAARHFARALELDPGDPEALHGRALTERRVAWRTEITASAEARVAAAQAEAEAMRRTFAAREGELESLKRELEKLKAAQREAEEKAARAEEEVRRREAALRAEHESRVREELFQRELEIEEKAQENVARALGEHVQTCPPAVRTALKVAETTFQKALYTQLPAAAVAVLFAGALERTLYLLFVERFRQWLKDQGQLAGFLKAAVRERRGTRVEYFDHFVEAFDEDRPGKAPSMGEVGRVLDRRKEPYLAAFDEFLSVHYPRPDAFWDEVVAFVLWAKEKLRDPVAHGRGIELGYEELKRFREQLLFSFGKRDRGMLAMLLG